METISPHVMPYLVVELAKRYGTVATPLSLILFFAATVRGHALWQHAPPILPAVDATAVVL